MKLKGDSYQAYLAWFIYEKLVAYGQTPMPDDIQRWIEEFEESNV